MNCGVSLPHGGIERNLRRRLKVTRLEQDTPVLVGVKCSDDNNAIRGRKELVAVRKRDRVIDKARDGRGPGLSEKSRITGEHKMSRARRILVALASLIIATSPPCPLFA